MPPSILAKEKLLSLLMAQFRRNGYDGTSMSEVTAKTGLGKSSLYHHFRGGKEEMAAAVLGHLSTTFGPVFEALRDGRRPAAKLDALLDAIDVFYDGGRTACLLERLSASADRARFAEPLKASFEALIGAFDGLCREVGLDRAEARVRAEDAVVRIEGALVVAAGTGDLRVFRRTIENIRASLLAPSLGPTRRGSNKVATSAPRGASPRRRREGRLGR